MIWLYRPPGGYGFEVKVAAKVDALVGRTKAEITVARKVKGRWQRERMTVQLRKLLPREQYVPAVDDEFAEAEAALDVA